MERDLETGNTYPVVELNEVEHGKVLYHANFSQNEDRYMAYMTMRFVIYALILIPFYGAGLLLLLYIPVYRYIARQDIRSRRLYITSESVVYRTAPPIHIFPCCGVNKMEKHTLLPLVTDVIVEQGCLEAKYGIQSIKIENAGQTGGKSRTYDVEINGIDDPRMFKKILLLAATARRSGRSITENDIKDMQSNEGDIIGNMGLYPSLNNNNRNEELNPMILEQLQKSNDNLVMIINLLKEQNESKKFI